MAAYLEDQMFAGFGALRVAHGKKEDGRQSPLPVLTPFPLLFFLLIISIVQPQLPGHQK